MPNSTRHGSQSKKKKLHINILLVILEYKEEGFLASSVGRKGWL
jgi:hypothetical protein